LFFIEKSSEAGWRAEEKKTWLLLDEGLLLVDGWHEELLWEKDVVVADKAWLNNGGGVGVDTSPWLAWCDELLDALLKDGLEELNKVWLDIADQVGEDDILLEGLVEAHVLVAKKVLDTTKDLLLLLDELDILDDGLEELHELKTLLLNNGGEHWQVLVDLALVLVDLVDQVLEGL